MKTIPLCPITVSTCNHFISFLLIVSLETEGHTEQPQRVLVMGQAQSNACDSVTESPCELRAEGLTPALTEPPTATLELPRQVRQQAPPAPGTAALQGVPVPHISPRRPFGHFPTERISSLMPTVLPTPDATVFGSFVPPPAAAAMQPQVLPVPCTLPASWERAVGPLGDAVVLTEDQGHPAPTDVCPHPATAQLACSAATLESGGEFRGCRAGGRLSAPGGCGKAATAPLGMSLLSQQ